MLNFQFYDLTILITLRSLHFKRCLSGINNWKLETLLYKKQTFIKNKKIQKVQMNENKIYSLLLIVCIIGIIVVTVLILINKQTEPFTELYFEDHQSLPKEIELGKEYFFEFTIHNLENKRTEYLYEIKQEIGIKNEVINTRIFSMDHNHSITFIEPFRINQIFWDARIMVNLPSKNQEIHFWVKQK